MSKLIKLTSKEIFYCLLIGELIGDFFKRINSRKFDRKPSVYARLISQWCYSFDALILLSKSLALVDVPVH